jgi:uncharacterized ferritin-like protein (DUF455 family)
MTTQTDLFARCLQALQAVRPEQKRELVSALRADWEQGRVSTDMALPVAPIGIPGRPPLPVLVSPLEVERRSVHTPEGHAALIHALAHIEFNAINLALDAIYRFRGLPLAYYCDWLQVAAEEAYHFQLLRDHLRTLGYDYGAFRAHDGLWEMAVKTAHDVLVRMALVPRVLEARGLDASPAISAKLRACGDEAGVAILAIIQRDEIGHVRIGNRWYAYLCAQRGLDPLATFRQLLRDFDAPRVRPPFATAARLDAGFSKCELEILEDFAREKAGR